MNLKTYFRAQILAKTRSCQPVNIVILKTALFVVTSENASPLLLAKYLASTEKRWIVKIRNSSGFGDDCRNLMSLAEAPNGTQIRSK